jgi:PAS domain S-box-containing protein
MSQEEKSGAKNGEAGLLLERVLPDRQLLMVNPGLCRMLGYTDEELLCKSIEELIYPDDRTPGIPELEQTLCGELNSYEAEKRYLHKNGSPVWVTVCSVAMKDGSGSVVYRLSIVHDATDRKRTEEHFRLMAEAAPYGMVMTNQNGKIVLMNSQIERIFGYQRDELIGQPIEILVPEPSRKNHAVSETVLRKSPNDSDGSSARSAWVAQRWHSVPRGDRLESHRHRGRNSGSEFDRRRHGT